MTNITCKSLFQMLMAIAVLAMGVSVEGRAAETTRPVDSHTSGKFPANLNSMTDRPVVRNIVVHRTDGTTLVANIEKSSWKTLPKEFQSARIKVNRSDGSCLLSNSDKTRWFNVVNQTGKFDNISVTRKNGDLLVSNDGGNSWRLKQTTASQTEIAAANETVVGWNGSNVIAQGSHKVGEIVEVSIVNPMGRQIWTGNIEVKSENAIQIPYVPALASTVYYIQIRNANDALSTVIMPSVR